MADQLEALHMADSLDKFSNPWDKGVASELRRLVAENERLHQINQSHEMKLSVRGYEIQIEDLRLAHAELRKRNAELLEALKFYGSSCDATESTPCGYEGNLCCKRARAAIARAEGELNERP
jgi:hypothetical protein